MATTADAEMAGGPGGPAPVVPFASIAVDGDKVLGAGTSGTVCECRWSGQTAALKMWSAGTFSDGTAVNAGVKTCFATYVVPAGRSRDSFPTLPHLVFSLVGFSRNGDGHNHR